MSKIDEIEVVIKVKVVDKCDDYEFCDSSGAGIPCRLLEVMGNENCHMLVDHQYVNLSGRLPNCPMNGGNKNGN